ncbi:MAG: hypothetical protein ACWA5Q_07605 [bacterium]
MVVEALSPDEVIIGTSRVGRGFHTSDAYNLGVRGLNLEEAVTLVEFVSRQRSTNIIYLGLDLEMFNAGGENRFTRLDAMFPGDTQAFSQFLGHFKRFKALLFTPIALEAALASVSNEAKTDLYGNFDNRDKTSRIKTLGHRKFTMLKEVSTKVNTSTSPHYSANLEKFSAMLKKAQNTNTQLTIFVPPMHIRQLLLLSAANQKSRYLQQLDDVTRVYCDVYPDGDSTPLVVFSGVNEITTEAFPEYGDTKSRMKGYFESSHFTPWVGQQILHRLDNQPQSDDFGEAVDCENRQAFVAQFQQRWELFENQHPALVEEIAQIVDQQ